MTQNQPQLKQTELGLIPENWVTGKFSDFIQINPFRELKKEQVAKKVSMDGINPFTRQIQSFTTDKFNGGSKFQNSDTLMARITPCLENGKTAYVDIFEDGEVVFGSTEFIVLSNKENITDSKYIYYLSISQKVRDKAIKSMVGSSGRQRVQVNELSDFVITIPKLSEQRQIASVLSSLDDKIELNRKMNKTLENIAKAIFKRWFVDFEFPNENSQPYKSSGGKMIDSELGQIPEGWKITNAEKELKIAYGKNLPTERLIDHGFPVYGGNGIIGYHSDYLYDESQIIIACRGAACGVLHKTKPKSFVTNNSLIFEIPKKSDLNIYYLENYLKIIDRSEFITGSAQPQITVSNLNHIKILVPDKIILDHFKGIIESNESIQFINNNSLETLSHLRDLLLPRLMSGRIRVK